MEKSNKSLNSDQVTVKNVGLKNKLLKRVGQTALSLVSCALIIGSAGAPAVAIDPAEATKQVFASEGAKAALNQALKTTRGKPALTLAAIITCGGCLPGAGVAASPDLCIACGILISKVIG